eukprot:snap_masked-scaffold_50-processed-gene-1.43-mRNA-1 protein AED:0.04 eAED:0.04 QI:0/-1/0/1/-1/1/1/0/218
MSDPVNVEVAPPEPVDSVEDMLNKLKLAKKKKKKKKSSSKTSKSAVTQQTSELPQAPNYAYGELLDRMYSLLAANNPELLNKKRAVLRPPEVSRVGTSKILWSNFPEICKMMKREPEHVQRFFLAELGSTGSLDSNGRFTIKGKFTPKSIESLLRKYISGYVTCQMCRGVQTTLKRDNMSRMYFMHCASCGANRTVTAIKAGYHATGKGERRAARANA